MATQVTLNSGSVDSAGSLALKTNGTTTAVTIDASQNVGIGTSSPEERLHIKSSVAGVYLKMADSTGTAFVGCNASALQFLTGSTERARITSSGYLLIARTTTSSRSGTATLQVAQTDANQAVAVENSNATPYGIDVYYSGAAPNNTSSSFINGADTGALRFQVRSNGGIGNYSANNVNLSDERTKTDIQNAGGYLAKICAIPVRTFKYKDQTDDFLNLGVIAQEVETVAPELVDVSGFGETPADGVPLKAIYQTDLQYALMKCIQEQQAIITQLQADVVALKGTA